MSKLKLTTFYTLIMCSLLYTNYTLINLENNNNTVFKKRDLRSKLMREGIDNQTWLNRKSRSKQVVKSQEGEQDLFQTQQWSYSDKGNIKQKRGHWWPWGWRKSFILYLGLHSYEYLYINTNACTCTCIYCNIWQ